MLMEQNDEWSLNRRYMQLEGLQSLCDTAPDSAGRCGSLSSVYLSLSGLWTYTTSRDADPANRYAINALAIGVSCFPAG